MVAKWQLLAVGISHAAVGRMVAAKRLVRLHRGVYAVGHAQLRAEGHWLAAVLACGEGAALAFRSAAALWHMRSMPAGKIDVIVPRGRRGPKTVRAHRPRELRTADVTTHRGIPVTTPMRTLRDLKRTLPPGELETVAARAATRGLITDAEAAAVTGHTPRFTRTRHERRFLKAVRAAGLPEPELNVWLTHGGGEEWQADALFRAERVIVELDGASHRTPQAFELDRYKDAVRQADGYRTLRVTDRMDLPSMMDLIRRVAYAAR